VLGLGRSRRPLRRRHCRRCGTMLVYRDEHERAGVQRTLGGDRCGDAESHLKRSWTAAGCLIRMSAAHPRLA
jgi:hypothetical protein